MKKQLGLIIGAIVIIALGVYIWQSNKAMPIAESQTTNSHQEIDTRAVEETKEPANSEESTTEPTTLKSVTMVDVTTHNNTSDCWATVDNNVYDLTPWISKHPGGEKAIIGLCGTDGTAAFTRQHGSNEKAKAALASFLIGSLVQ